jgi:hypothetical protein
MGSAAVADVSIVADSNIAFHCSVVVLVSDHLTV